MKCKTGVAVGLSREDSRLRPFQYIARFISTLCLFLTLSILANAATITVTNTNDSGAGSLRQAIAAAASGDTINFGVTGTVTLTSGPLAIDKNLTIQGPGRSLLSISGNNASTVFFILSGATATLVGMMITEGHSADFTSGGGLANGGTLTVINSAISNNAANFDGGGIANGGTLTVVNSVISNNIAGPGGDGGGLYNTWDGTLAIVNSTVAGNVAVEFVSKELARGGYGGGIHNAGGVLSVSNSTISGNSDEHGGGGMVNIGGGMTTVSNSTISGNTTTYGSGGIGAYGSAEINLNNSTVTGNVKEEFFSGGSGGISPFGDTELNIHNSIVAGNVKDVGTGDYVPDDIRGNTLITSASHNLIGDAASSGGITNGVNGNIVGVNPLLGPLQNNGGPTLTHALLVGSPAINAGNNSLAVDVNGQPLQYDQRGAGFPRITGGNVDIGALEATVSVSGYVRNADGRGVLAFVTINGPQGSRTTAASRLGYYRFDGVAVGYDYTITAASRRYSFQPRVVRVDGALINVDFIAEH